MYETASQCWTRLAAIKDPLLKRCERYAALTIPKLCLPLGFIPEQNDQTHDYQSIGAQAVNHVVNKLMIAMFAPGRPFMKLQLQKAYAQKMSAEGIDPDAVTSTLAQAELDALKELDARAQRPKLYQIMRHLVAMGNVLMILGDEIRVMGIRSWCVKRDIKGRVHTLIIKEHLRFDELEQEVRNMFPKRYSPETQVDFYKLLKRQPNGDIRMTQWVNETQLPNKYDGKWPEEKCPYRVLCWDLADESDYATGLVEEYSGDLEALSILSEATVDGAVLGAEFRALCDPSGVTTADDFNNSKNGDAVAGKPADIAYTQGGNPDAIRVADEVSKRYEQRVARGFLLSSAVTRDAERVTAEEIRLTAQELESAFGGVYSTLGPSVQKPIAEWLFKAIDITLGGTALQVTIITGLDALSRNGDLENLRLALTDLAGFASLPPALLDRMNFEKVAEFVGQGRGVNLSKFMLSEDAYQAKLQQQAQARVAEQSAIAGGEATAQASAQQGTQ